MTFTKLSVRRFTASKSFAGSARLIIRLVPRSTLSSAGLYARCVILLAVQKPSVGRMVHYVAYGTPGGEFPAGACRAAPAAKSNRWGGNPEKAAVIELLVAKGAEVNARANDGTAPRVRAEHPVCACSCGFDRGASARRPIHQRRVVWRSWSSSSSAPPVAAPNRRSASRHRRSALRRRRVPFRVWLIGRGASQSPAPAARLAAAVLRGRRRVPGSRSNRRTDHQAAWFELAAAC